MTASPDRAGLLAAHLRSTSRVAHSVMHLTPVDGPWETCQHEPCVGDRAALAATGDSGGRQAPCDDEQLRSAFMKGVESAEEARAMKEAGDSEGPLDLLLAAESVRDTLAVGHQPTIDQYDALNAAVNKRTLVKP